MQIDFGIKEPGAKSSQIKIYPNPNNGTFNIELKGRSTIRVYSSIGVLVFEEAFYNNATPTVTLPDLAAGSYHLRVQSSSGNAYNKLLIK